MASPFHTRFAAQVAPDLLATFGETITRYPEQTGAGVELTAIVTLQEGRVDRQSGKAHVHAGYCDIAATDSVAVKDQFDIRGQSVEVKLIREAQSGLIRFWFQRVSQERRTRGHGEVL